MEQTLSGVNYSVERDDCNVNVWLAENGKNIELLYSEDIYKLRANYADYYQQAGLTLEQFLTDAVMYGQLAVMMQDCFMLQCQRPLDEQEALHLKHYGGLTDTGIHFCADKELSDSEKFICALITCDNCDYGLTSKTLNKLFGWTTYKARKVARSVQHKVVVSLVSEISEGYFGKGWILTGAMRRFVSSYKYKVSESKKSGV